MKIFMTAALCLLALTGAQAATITETSPEGRGWSSVEVTPDLFGPGALRPADKPFMRRWDQFQPGAVNSRGYGDVRFTYTAEKAFDAVSFSLLDFHDQKKSFGVVRAANARAYVPKQASGASNNFVVRFGRAVKTFTIRLATASNDGWSLGKVGVCRK